VVANFRRRDVLQSWQMAISAPLPIRDHPAIFAPGDLMSAHGLADAAEVAAAGLQAGCRAG